MWNAESRKPESFPEYSGNFSLVGSRAGEKTPANVISIDAAQKKYVEVPNLLSFNDWFFRHYRQKMTSMLHDMLLSGELRCLVGVDFIDRDINRFTCEFQLPKLYLVSRNEFLADVEVKIDLHTPEGEVFPWEAILTYRFTVTDHSFAGSGETVIPKPLAEKRELVALDMFLIPCYSNQRMNVIAEGLWSRTIPAALTDPEVRSGRDLAAALGLSVKYLPVADPEKDAAYLFFATGVLPVMEEEDGEFFTRKQQIPAGTIVVNISKPQRGGPDYAIYHEVIHHQLHYLFFRLQEMGTSSLRNIPMKKITVEKSRKVKDSLYFMENQADRGAYALLLPEHDTRSRILEEMKHSSCLFHKGYQMQGVIRALMEQLDVPPFRVRARLVQLGYVEAKGAMNFVDGNWIQPFDFNPESLPRENMTFVVSESDIRKMKEENPDFRDFLEKRNFIYADGHLIHRKYTTKGPLGTPVLTMDANSHVDQYCLRFIRVYEQSHLGKYVLGRMTYDADYVKRTYFFLEDTINARQLDEIDAKYDFIRNLPDNFRDAFNFLMGKNGMTQEILSDEMDMDPRALRRILSRKPGNIPLDFIIAFALACQMPDWLTEQMLNRAYIRLWEENKRHRAILYIMRAMWMDGIEKANEYLASKGLEPLTY